MGKLRVLSGREVCRILKENGSEQVRQHGDHVAMQKKTGNVTRTVPVPLHKEIKPGTLGSIIRQSGLERSLFEE